MGSIGLCWRMRLQTRVILCLWVLLSAPELPLRRNVCSCLAGELCFVSICPPEEAGGPQSLGESERVLSLRKSFGGLCTNPQNYW